jgi:hypothetical protein
MDAVADSRGVDADMLIRAYGEYREMPGLQLTLAQAARLWNVDRVQAARILETLVDAAFLCRRRDAYVRAD